VILKGQGRDPNMLRALCLEDDSKRPPLRNDVWESNGHVTNDVA